MSLRQVMIQSRLEAEEQALRQINNVTNLNMNGTVVSSSRPLSSTNATKISHSIKKIGNGTWIDIA